MDKEKCDCGKMAVWCYMPGYSSGSNPHHCDDCVSRGCSCNWKSKKHRSDDDNPPSPETENIDWRWITDEDRKKQGLDTPIEEKTYWIDLDENGREDPCCEHFYDKDGWDIDKDPTQQEYEKAVKDGRVM